MAISRRGFIGRFMAGVAAAVAAPVVADFDLDPERALWVPGAKTFFFPPEKKLITDAESVTKTYMGLDQQEIKSLLKHGLLHEVHTGRGRVVFDKDWNILTLRGAPVSAHEAARMQSEHYQSGGTPYHTPPQLETIARTIQARWDLAGLNTPAMREAAAKGGTIAPTRETVLSAVDEGRRSKLLATEGVYTGNYTRRRT